MRNQRVDELFDEIRVAFRFFDDQSECLWEKHVFAQELIDEFLIFLGGKGWNVQARQPVGVVCFQAVLEFPDSRFAI